MIFAHYVTLIVMWSFIKQYPAKYWRWYLLGIGALVITTWVTTMIPLQIMAIIDAIHQDSSWSQLKSHVGWLVALAVALAMFRTLSRILIFRPGRYVEYDLRRAIHAHLITLPPDFFRHHTTGDIMSRMINDIQSLRLMSAFGLLQVVNTGLIYALVMAQMVAIHATLTMWVLLPIPFAMLAVRLFVKTLHQTIGRSQKQLGAITNFFVESVSNMTLIKTFNAEASIIHEMNQDNVAYRTTQIFLARIRSTMFPFIGIIGSLGQILLLYWGGNAVIDGQITIGQFVAFSTYLTILAWPTAALSWIITIIQRGLVSLKRMNEILSVPAHPQYRLGAPVELTRPPKIELRNVSFSYPNTKKPCLNRVSITIEPGQILGIFGPTGSGKTTLANILSTIEPVQSGQVLLNDTDITTMNVVSLRRGVAMVPQNRFLFSATIQENILFSDPEADNAVASQAAKRACVYDDIQRFPHTWQTLVGEKGVVLSGGQQHRLALSRAYASSHYVLILDDVLSSVDHGTEHKMIQSLYESDQRPTTVIISHRISALQPCDHVIVLDDGEVVDEGRHDELIQRSGRYQATWQYQELETSTNE